MKYHLRTNPNLRHLFALALAASLALPLPSLAASIALATSPLATSTTSTVRPNVMFLLDNSGSMAWDHMPDDSTDGGSAVTYSYGYYGIRSNQCNEIYYDPNITYLAPVDSTGLPYTDASITAAWTNGFNTGSGSVDLTTGFKANQSGVGGNAGGTDSAGPAYYYNYSGAQLSQQQKNVNSTTSTYYNECHSAQGASPGKDVFTKIQLSPTATATTATIVASCSSCTSTTVSSIKRNGTEEIMSGTTAGSTTTGTVAANIAAQINLCTAAQVGNCTTAGGHGYTATVSGSTVTITGLNAATASLILTQSGSMTLNRTIIPVANTAQLTNFANWYSFYRTRLLMMKTAAGRAFKTLDSHYRVGFTKLSSSNTPSVYMDTFTGTQRTNWYTQLYGTSASGSTPLREALSDAGRYYAGKESGADPMQYSCQQNFTIMSTDGFWNGNAGYQLDGSTAVGNQDGGQPRPMYDGSAISMIQTQVRQSQTQTTQQTSSLIGTLSKVLMSCNNTAAACGAAPTTGVANANWSVVTAGSCNSTTNMQCAVVSGLSGTSAVANMCKTSASITTGTGYSSISVTITNANNVIISRVRSDGTQNMNILNASTAASSNNNTVASNVANGINACSTSIPNNSNCNFSGSSATVNGNVVTITGPNITSGFVFRIPNNGGGSATLTYSSVTAGGTAYTLNNADSNGDIYSSCAYSAWSAPALTASCTVVNQSSTPNNTSVATASQCTTSTYSPLTLVASCTVGNSGAPNYIQTNCTSTNTTTNNVTSCTAQPASSSNNYTATTCAAGGGGTSDTLADVAMYYYQTDLRTSALNNCTGAAGVDVCANNVFKTDTDTNTSQHMVTFTLGMGANGKMDYSPSYPTDGTGDYYSVWAPNPPNTNGYISADSTQTPPVCSWQANGTVCNWPFPGMDSNGNGYISNIDDLWHAAVDGHGMYFSATSPTSLSAGLSTALASIASRNGAAAAAATSTLNPVPGNNYAYVASYTTVKWQGNLEARTIDVNTGVVSSVASWCVENIAAGTCAAPSTIVADTSGSSTTYNCVTASSTAATCIYPAVFDTATSECRLPMAVACVGTMPGKVAANSDTRTIYTANGTGSALVNFDATYATANPTNFAAGHINTLSQWSSLTTTQQAAAVGTNLINFLRGQTGYEDRAINLVGAVDNRLYRYREATLGDVLESQPIFIGAPVFSYTDAGYDAFKTAQASRPGTVYVGANDGMLHAISALAEGAVPGGTERWAYVPSMVIPNMWKLADKNYATMHTNFVNGSPIVSDVCTANCTDSATAVWRTILVGGLDAGGRGYYALDVTDPTAPTLLWEFTTAIDSDVGYSYGTPVITAKADGTWVVLVTSGYNNTSPGSGLGYLYVLDAATGAINLQDRHRCG